MLSLPLLVCGGPEDKEKLSTAMALPAHRETVTLSARSDQDREGWPPACGHLVSLLAAWFLFCCLKSGVVLFIRPKRSRGGHFGEFGLVFAEILLLCFAQQEDCSGCSCACCRRQEGAEPSPALAEVSSAVGTYTPTQHQVNANLRER